MDNAKLKKKLIEVALPLDAINREAAHDKNIHNAHAANLHWWAARRPLAACRALLFAQLVDDPSSHPERFPTEEAQEGERKRLFGIIESIIKWENSNNPTILRQASEEIRKSCDEKPPAVLDPFCGRGVIPLEAQRLGLSAYASDLNPVAVLITKALIEIPPKFASKPPINPEARKKMLAGSYKGAQGLAEDVRYYGKWMRDEAERRIGHLYPKIRVTTQTTKDCDDLRGFVGRELTVIAWLWARSIECPNPACGREMPLITSLQLSAKAGRVKYLDPKIERGTIKFAITNHPPRGNQDPKKGFKRGLSGIFACAFCGNTTTRDYVANRAVEQGLGLVQTAVVAETDQGRVYLPPSLGPVDSSIPEPDTSGLDLPLSPNPRDTWCRNFGLKSVKDLFTRRQLVALTTFSDLLSEARESVLKDARAAGMVDDGTGIDEGGTGATSYADAVATYLSFCLDRLAQTNNSLVRWLTRKTAESKGTPALDRQALPMVWDFAEGNVFCESVGSWDAAVRNVVDAFSSFPLCAGDAAVLQMDASSMHQHLPANAVICTDPPYYDNISYADLSDFFYVWLRRSVGKIYPGLFSTVLVPKAQELVATPYRFDGSKERAQQFFEEGLGKAFSRMRETQNPAYPLTLFYAFKQAETEQDDDEDRNTGTLVSTGWETMLEGLIRAGFQVAATWPVRSEGASRLIAIGTNALASSVMLACRTRRDDAPLATRREFVQALRSEMPAALRALQHGSIAPVDLAQAAIGPGMAVFSRYSKVLETDGSALRVRTALGLINQALDEILAEQEGEYDAETRWALAWFEQYGTGQGKYGDAETLSRAKDTAVNALVEARIITAGAGKVQLVPRSKLNPDWDPAADRRLTIWTLTQHLIRALETGGDAAAARIIRRVGSLADTAKDLAYRLYVICDRKGWSQEALAYNMLVKSWPELQKLAAGTEGESARLL